MIEIEIELRDTSVRLRYTSVEGSLPLSSLIFTANNDQFTVLAVFHSAMLAQRLFFPRPAPSRFREIPDFVTRTRPCSLPLSLELVVHDRAEESADRACTAPFVSEAWIEPREFGLALEKSVEKQPAQTPLDFYRLFFTRMTISRDELWRDNEKLPLLEILIHFPTNSFPVQLFLLRFFLEIDISRFVLVSF